MYQLGKIRRHHWRKRIKLSKTGKFGIEDVAEICKRLYDGRQVCALPPLTVQLQHVQNFTTLKSYIFVSF